jgi:phosphoglycolate phosphatase-like HAD superfamily hydrolase
MIGMSPARLLAELVGAPDGSALARSILERQSAILKAHYLPDVGPFHGARMLVDRLRSRGLVCAALATATTDDVLDLLRAAAVADLMDTIVSAADENANTNLVALALERIGILPDEALLIGDTPFDIEAGEHAGVNVVAFRCGGGWTDRDLAGAVSIYDDPAGLSSSLDNSPLALDRESDPPPSPIKIAVRGARTSYL